MMRIPCLSRPQGITMPSYANPQQQEQRLNNQQQRLQQPQRLQVFQPSQPITRKVQVQQVPQHVQQPYAFSGEPSKYETPKTYYHHPNNESTRAVSKVSSTGSKGSTAAASSGGVSKSSSSDNEIEDLYNHYLVSNEILPDPVPYVAPKSKKMALGSITFSAEQGYELGVPKKDNSFYLRVEKCDPVFYDKLNFEIENLVGHKMPDVEDPTEYWPEGALLAYSRNPNRALKREMDRVYRHWHDSRCGMDSLIPRLNYVKQKLMQMRN